MTTFSTRNASVEAVSAPLGDVWAAMSQPDLLASLTPLVARIEADGDTWVWCLSGIDAMGVSIAPCFTEAMTLEEPNRIEFRHAPPADTEERAGADGAYLLREFDGGTILDIDLAMHVELPLPALSRGAVERVMARSTQAAGDRFFANLLAHLGARKVPVPASVG